MKPFFAALGLCLLLHGVAQAQLTVAGPSGTQPATSQPRVDEPEVVTLTVSPAAEPSPALKYLFLPPPPEQTPGDALVIYMTLQGQDSLKGEIGEKVRQWRFMPAAQLPRQEILDTLPTLIRQLDVAARRQSVHWDYPIREMGVSTTLPSLGKFRDHAYALSAWARVLVAEGRYDEAAHTLQTLYGLSQHLAQCHILIQSLVAASCAGAADSVLQDWVQKPDAPNLYWTLAQLPRPLVSIRSGIAGERYWLYLSCPALYRIAQGKALPGDYERANQDLAETMGMVQDGGEADALLRTGLYLKLYPEGKKHLLAQGRSPEQVEAMPVAQVVSLYMIDEFQKVSDGLHKWFSVPFWQAHDGLAQAEGASARARKNDPLNPLLQLMPSVGRAYFMEARLDRQIAALQTIEAVRMYAADHEGQMPTRLDDLVNCPAPFDPVTGKPFEYSVDGRTFTLNCPVFKEMSIRDAARYVVTVREQPRRAP